MMHKNIFKNGGMTKGLCHFNLSFQTLMLEKIQMHERMFKQVDNVQLPKPFTILMW